MTAVLLEGVSKTYRRSWGRPPFTAVQDVSFSIAEGEAFGFIGANGAGKSTTIKMLTGALLPSKGRLELFGRPVSDSASRQGMGYVPENPSLPDLLSPLEILTMGIRLHGGRERDMRGHCMQWLEKFGLAQVATRPIRTFSKGMMQRVALAHALALNPRLLILDEPLSGLDPIGRKEVVDILDEYHVAGGTLLFSSHVLHDVERLADRFGLIHKGSLLALSSPNDLVGGEQAYIVRSLGELAYPGARQETPGRWASEVSGDVLWERLNQLQAAGHQLIEVRPTLTLEGVFFRYLQSSSG
jgi:ABC-2 type transport system ATP-binding protein